MKTIPLSQGKIAIVDDEDHEWLSRFKWYCSVQGYAIRHIDGSHNKMVLMHREILKTPNGLYSDHINLNRLDNRKSNLRICSNAENMRNSKIKENRFKGVCFLKAIKKWRAQITINYSNKHLGYFSNPEEAARAYDQAAKKFFGEFAKLNFS